MTKINIVCDGNHAILIYSSRITWIQHIFRFYGTESR